MDRIKKLKRREKLIRLKQEKRRESLRFLEKQRELEKIKQDQIKKDALKLHEMVQNMPIAIPPSPPIQVVNNIGIQGVTGIQGVVNSNFNKEAWSIKPNTVEEPVKVSGFDKDAWKVKE